MTTVDAQFSGVRDAFEKASRGYGYGLNPGGRSASTAKTPSTEATSATPSSEAKSVDTVHDTVSLSAGGQKIVNLNRGQELSQQIKNAPVDKDFAENLRKATQDVFRITELFTQTVKSAFNRTR